MIYLCSRTYSTTRFSRSKDLKYCEHEYSCIVRHDSRSRPGVNFSDRVVFRGVSSVISPTMILVTNSIEVSMKV